MIEIKNSIPGIKAIHAVVCSHLTPMLSCLIDDVVEVPVLCTPRSLHPVDVPTCEIEGKEENGAPIEEAVLKFTTTRPPRMGTSIAYILTDEGGKHYLLGTREWPRPETSVTLQTGTPGGDAKIYQVEVRYKSRRALLACIFPELSAKPA